MTDWITSIDGTDAGRRLALILALISACAHAAFGALQKGRHDPWLIRGAIDISYLSIALPVALFVVPWPTPQVWLLLIGVFFIHLAYKLLLAMAYSRGSYTAVYPVVRGTAPLVTIIFAGVVFQETFTRTQWLGVGFLSGGIFALGIYNIVKARVDRQVLVAALGFAFLTGLSVALYTTYDAYGVRAAPNPFTFIAWFFVIDGLSFPLISYSLWRRMPEPPPIIPLLVRGFWGSFIGMASFGCVMMATRLDKVGEAAVLRETSVVFAALIGWFVLKETVGPRRLAMMVAIAFGAVLVEFGG